MKMPQHNFIVNIADTDSISFCKADMSQFTREEIVFYVKEINDISPEFMQWENDGDCDSVLVLRAKNYILVKNGKYTYRGSSLKDTKREPAVREMIRRMITDIIENDSRSVVDIYNEYNPSMGIDEWLGNNWTNFQNT